MNLFVQRFLGGYLTNIAAASIVLLTSAAVYAQEVAEESDVKQLADMSLDSLLNVTVTTATKTSRTLEQSPSIVTVFSRREIDNLGVRNLADLLRFVPGFYEVASALQRNFSVRGIHSESPQHFVVLLDGLPTSDLLTSTSVLESFALDYVDRVEIIRGPGSAIYGASALMGVVNLITRDGNKDKGFRETAHVGTGQYFRNDISWGDDFGKQRDLYLSGSVWMDKGTEAQVGASQDVLLPRMAMNISDGIQAGENLTFPQARNPVDVGRVGPSVDLLAKFRLEDKLALRLNFSHSDAYLQRGVRQALVDSDTELQPPRYVTNRVMVDLERRFGEKEKLGELLIRPSVAVFTHDMRSPTIPQRFYDLPEILRNPGRDTNAVIYGWAGTDLQLSNSFEYSLEIPDFLFTKDNTLVAGLTGTYGVASNYNQSRCFLDPNGTVANLSVYGAKHDLYCRSELFLREDVSVDDFGNATAKSSSHLGDGDQWQLGTFAQYATFFPREIGLVLGTRFDYLSDFNLQWSPRVAMVAPLFGGTYAKAQYSQAFIYPAFLYRMGNKLSYYSGDPGVESESIASSEFLLGYKSDFVRAELNGYYNRIRQFITFDPRRNAQTGQYVFGNQGDLDVAGTEFSTQFNFFSGNLGLRIHGAYNKALATTDGIFLLNKKLAGPTTSPAFVGGAVVSGVPYVSDNLRINATVSFLYASKTEHRANAETQFSGVTGADGQIYSSRLASDYPTEMVLVETNLTADIGKNWRAGLLGTNLLDRRSYAYGSLAVPLLREGRRVIASLTYKL